MFNNRVILLSVATAAYLSGTQLSYGGPPFCDDLNQLIQSGEPGTFATSKLQKTDGSRFQVVYQAPAKPIRDFSECMVTKSGPTEAEVGGIDYRCSAPPLERKRWSAVLAKFQQCLGGWEVQRPKEYGPSAELYAQLTNGPQSFTLVFVPPEGNEDLETDEVSDGSVYVLDEFRYEIGRK